MDGSQFSGPSIRDEPSVIRDEHRAVVRRWAPRGDGARACSGDGPKLVRDARSSGSEDSVVDWAPAIGSEAVAYFGARGHAVVGVDNNMREVFFAP